MKKIINSVFCFLCGAIIFGGISVYATVGILSKDILYVSTNTDFLVDNVSDALDNLYSNATASAYDRLGFESNRNVSFGNRAATRTATLTLESGSYLLFSTYVHSRTVSSSASVEKEEITISFNNTTGTCEMLDGYRINITGTSVYSNTSLYTGLFTETGIWKCKFTEQSVVTVQKTVGADIANAQSIKLNSIKLD